MPHYYLGLLDASPMGKGSRTAQYVTSTRFPGGRCRTGPKTMGSAVVLHTAPPRSRWPHQMQGWPSKGTAETPAPRQRSDKMGAVLQEAATCTSSESSVWSYVPSCENTETPKGRRRRSGLTHHQPSRSLEASVFPTHATRSSASCRSGSPRDPISAKGRSQGPTELQVSAAIRAP